MSVKVSKLQARIAQLEKELAAEQKHSVSLGVALAQYKHLWGLLYVKRQVHH